MHRKATSRVVSPEHRALGRAVRELRARRGYSQEAMGERSTLHRNYIGAIERGQINPTFETLLRLVHGLALPLSELVSVYERHMADPRGTRTTRSRIRPWT